MTTMPYAEWVHWRSCGRKVRHLTRSYAWMGIWGMVLRTGRPYTCWRPYPCDACGGWHVATVRGAR